MPQPITDLSPPASALGVDFTWSPTASEYLYPDSSGSGALTCPVDVAVTFTAQASTPPGLTIVSYEWDFGDGATATGSSATHTFVQRNPTLRVRLCVTDSGGTRQCVGHQMSLPDPLVLPSLTLYPDLTLYPNG